jgi:hypothetical protein
MRWLAAVLMAIGAWSLSATQGDSEDRADDDASARSTPVPVVPVVDTREAPDREDRDEGRSWRRDGGWRSGEGRWQDSDDRRGRYRGRSYDGPGMRRSQGPPDEEELRQLRALVQEHFPRLHERLAELERSDPRGFRVMQHRMHGPLSEIIRLRRENPEVARKMIATLQVRLQMDELMREYQAAESDTRRTEIREQLREQLRRGFDLRVERMRDQIRELEERLEQARQQLVEQEQNKDRLIERELEGLLSGRPGGPPDRGPPLFRRPDGLGPPSVPEAEPPPPGLDGTPPPPGPEGAPPPPAPPDPPPVREE